MTTELTLTIPPDLAIAMQQAVDSGRFKTPEAVVEHALRTWQDDDHVARLTALRAEIQLGLDDVAAGRVYDWDLDSILAEGRQELARRAASD